MISEYIVSKQVSKQTSEFTWIQLSGMNRDSLFKCGEKENGWRQGTPRKTKMGMYVCI